MESNLDLEKYLLKTYKRNNRDCYFDPVSKILRIVTPEETVRQKLLLSLYEQLHYPYTAIRVEEPTSRWKEKAKGRMDILVLAINKANQSKPLMVVECKAPYLGLFDETYEQSRKYARTITAPVHMVFNGNEYGIEKWSTNKWQKMVQIPNYQELCDPNNLKAFDYVQEPWNPIEMERIASDYAYNDATNVYFYMGEDTPRSYLPFLVNLYDGLMADTPLCKYLQLRKFSFVKDNGRRYTSYGNAAGGSYSGFYRSFLICNSEGNNQIISIGIFGTQKTDNDPLWGTRRSYTSLIVAVDDFDMHHNALQLNVDDCVVINDRYANIYHNGKMTVGNKGSAKSQDVIDFIHSNNPSLIVNNQIFLGRLDFSKRLNIDSPDMQAFLSRIICYALLRDELRQLIKSR